MPTLTGHTSPIDIAYYWNTVGMDSRDRYYMESFLGGLPIIGAFFQARDKVNYMEDYMRNRGLDWSSIKYPTMTMGYQGVSGLTSYVSSNIERLYK